MAKAPVARIASLQEYPSLSRPPIVLTRFWTLHEAEPLAFAWLRAHAPAGQQLGGATWHGPAGVTEQSFEREQVDSLLPDSMADGEIYVAVVRTGRDTSAVAGYALALAQPTRPAAEIVPPRAVTVTLRWYEAPHAKPSTRMIRGRAATRFVGAFDALWISADGGIEPGLPEVPREDIWVTFVSGGDVWRARLRHAAVIEMSRNGGRQLPVLDVSADFLAQVKRWTGHTPATRASSIAPGAPSRGHDPATETRRSRSASGAG